MNNSIQNNVRFDGATAMFNPMVSSSSASPTGGISVGGGTAAPVAAPRRSITTGSTGESIKRKRGRPRKYSPDPSMAFSLASPLTQMAQPPNPSPAAVSSAQPQPFPLSSGKKRGRPRGSGTKHRGPALGYGLDGTSVYKPVVHTASPTPAYQPSNITGGGVGGDGNEFVAAHSSASGGESTKRKRGRPRKYSQDGSMAFAVMSSMPPLSQAVQPLSAQPVVAGVVGGAVSYSGKKRGRPLGSCNKHQANALGSRGVRFSPHVITVEAGEDVLAKLMSFSQNEKRAVCVLSASGAISNVTLHQTSSGGTVTYEGRFEILSLSGSFLLTEGGGQHSRTGGLSVALSGSDGRVLGGGVAGLLTAAVPVKVIIGSFIEEAQKQSKVGPSDGLTAQSKHVPGVPAAGSPPSRGTLSESSGGHGSPLNQSTGAYNNSNPHGMINMPWR